jgi:uncharacterized membrane protein YfcA
MVGPKMLGGFLAEALSGLSPASLALAALVVFGAGFLRGFTGFGFSLAAVPALTLMLDPAVVVPCSLILSLLAGVQVLPKLRRLVHWRAVWILLAGSLAGTPPGVYLLGALPANALRLGIGVVLIGSVALLWRQPRLLHSEALPFGFGAGFISGLLNGSTGMGGPPAVLYFLNSVESVPIARASLVMYFFFASLGTLAYGAADGLIGRHVLLLSLLFLPPLYIGNFLGDRCFDGSSAATYRRVALGALLLLALLSVGRALAEL